MTALAWDQTGERLYETGVDHGVLYIADNGLYEDGVAWNGLTAVTESPEGAEPSALYADNIKYLNLLSAEEFKATIEAYTYPDEFMQCDGAVEAYQGVMVTQQDRKTFGLCYRTILGNDVDSNDFGYKLHLIWGAKAAPSEKAFATVNDTPEAITFSWEVSTTPVAVTDLKPTAHMVINSTQVDPDNLASLEEALYGTESTDPRLPLPDEVIGMFAGAQTLVTPAAPTFVAATGVITIVATTGVTYRRDDTNAIVSGTVTITVPGNSLLIKAYPASGAYAFTAFADDDWMFTRDP